MNVNSIQTNTKIMQSTQVAKNINEGISQNVMNVRIIGLMQGICSLLIIVGLIVGIVYMIKSKKTIWKKILIGAIIILIPIILNCILGVVKFNMLLNM